MAGLHPDNPTVEDDETYESGQVTYQEPEQNHFQNDPSKGFSFDNIPPSKWRDKIYEMHAWCTAELL